MAKQKKAGRPPAERKKVHAATRLYEDVNAQLDALAERQRRTKSSEIALAVEAWLNLPSNKELLEKP